MKIYRQCRAMLFTPPLSKHGKREMAETVETTPNREDEESGWRRWLPWIALVAIILLVAWLLWLYGDWKSPSGRDVGVAPSASVRVPDVIGLDAEEATSILEQAGLSAEEDVSYDQYADPGTVSSQAPASGSRVSPGTTVLIEVVAGINAASDSAEEPDYQGEAKGLTGRSAKSIRRVRVPDVMGLSESAAIAAVEARGLSPRPLYQPRPGKPRVVFQQSPPVDELVPIGSQVHFLIAVTPN